MTADQLPTLARHVIETVWRSSWQAAVIALLVLAVQLLLRDKLPPRWRYNLWLLVLLRLLVPVTPPAKFSLFNLAPREQVPVETVPLATPIALDPSSPAAAATTSPPQPPRADANRWPLIIASLWAAGAAAMLLRITWASFRLSHSIRRMRRVSDAEIVALVHRCSEEMHVARVPIVLRSSNAVAAPALMGFWRPRLLLPAHVLDTFAPAELRLIILHELAHLKRGDVAANWLVSVLQSLHWFNPILHVAFARLRSDRELAADDMVLSITSDDERRDYGQTIVKLVETLPSRRLALAGTVGILERAHPLRRRITMIARFSGNTSRRNVMAVLFMIALAALALTDRVRGDNAVAGAAAPSSPAASRPAATSVAATQQSADAAGEDPHYVAMLAQLQRRLPEINFQQIPLADAIDFLREVTGANIDVGWKAFEGAGLDRNEPVTLRVRNVTFEQVLRQLCRQMGGGHANAGFTVDGGVILISTVDDLAKSGRSRAYDVADLLTAAGPGSKMPTTRPAREELVELVEANVAPDSWREKGGAVGTMREFNGRLIVTTIDMYHFDITRFLDELRRR
jgi:bla regulator protein BlaR1